MDIIHQYVLEKPIPERQPLYIPSDASLPVEKIQENGDDQEEGQPPKKKQKRERGNKTQERCVNPNLTSMQHHLFHLLRALVSKQHHIRDALARCKAGDIAAFEHVLQLVEIACAKGIKEYAETNGKSWEEDVVKEEREKEAKVKEQIAKRELERKGTHSAGGVGKKVEKDGEGEDDEMDESSLQTVRECRRPWWVLQPYVRPLPKEALAKGSLTLSKKQIKAMKDDGGSDGVVARDEKVVDVGKEKVDVGGDGVPVGTVVDVTTPEGAEKVEIPKDGLVCG